MDALVTKTADLETPAERDPRWARVVARDRSAEGRFFYSVATTGVYCRPSCAARRANPKNVRFHPTIADAEAAGFRPCKRCKPDQPSLDEQYAAMVAELCRMIESADEAPTLATLAKAGGPQRLPFSPRLQGGHGRNAQGLRHGAPDQPGPGSAFKEQDRDRSHL